MGGWTNTMMGGHAGWGGMDGIGGVLGGFWMIFMWVVPLVVLGVLVWFIIDTARRRDRNPLPAPPAFPAQAAGVNALVLLDERYAKGEIERADYLQRRQDLGG